MAIKIWWAHYIKDKHHCKDSGRPLTYAVMLKERTTSSTFTFACSFLNLQANYKKKPIIIDYNSCRGMSTWGIRFLLFINITKSPQVLLTQDMAVVFSHVNTILLDIHMDTCLELCQNRWVADNNWRHK